MADRHSKEVRSYNMSHIRSKDTKPEEMVRKYLFSKGLRYRKNDKRFPGRPDIVLPRYRVIIFINGCFWHMHENCSKAVIPKSNQDYWIPKLENNRLRDLKNISALQEKGWKVIVLWECELAKICRLQRLEKLFLEIAEELII